MTTPERRIQAATRAINRAGGRAEVARHVGLSWDAVDAWQRKGRIPTEYLRDLCRLSRLEPWQVCPEIPRPSRRWIHKAVRLTVPRLPA